MSEVNLKQSRERLNEVLDFLVSFHGMDSNSIPPLDEDDSLDLPNACIANIPSGW